MADPKKYFQLVNYEGQNALDIIFGDSNSSTDEWYYCDWDLDGNGLLRTVQEQDAVVQGSLKNIFTEKQLNGLGTNVFSLIGEKDIMVKRMAVIIDLTMSMLAWQALAEAQRERQDLSPSDLLSTMTKFSVKEDESNPSVVRINMALKMVSDEEIPITVF